MQGGKTLVIRLVSRFHGFVDIVAVDVDADAYGGTWQCPLDLRDAAGKAAFHFFDQIRPVGFRKRPLVAGLHLRFAGHAEHLLRDMDLGAEFHGKAQLFQFADDQRRRTVLRPGRFRMFMQIAADPGQILLQGSHIDSFKRHSSFLSSSPGRGRGMSAQPTG